jgi:hypothetical protein
MTPNRARPGLFERGLDASEGRVQACSKARYDRYDRNRDTGGDEAVFDGRRSGFVSEKPQDKFSH